MLKGYLKVHNIALTENKFILPFYSAPKTVIPSFLSKDMVEDKIKARKHKGDGISC